MKKCPFKNCGQTISDKVFCCGRHWKSVPVEQKNALSQAFGRYLDEIISLSELHLEQCRVLAELQGLTLEAVLGDARLIHSVCRRCGCQMILANRRDGSGRISLAEVTAAATFDPDSGEGDGEDVYCVVGYTAVPSRGRRPIYTRFVEHRCAVSAAHAAPRHHPAPLRAAG
jgi:hypothetical protein